MSKLLQKGEKTLLPSTVCHCKKKKAQKALPPYLGDTCTGRQCIKRAIPHTLSPEGELLCPRLCSTHTHQLISKQPTCRHPLHPKAAAQWCVAHSFDSVDAVNAEFLRTHKKLHVRGHVQGHSLDDRGNFIS